MAWHALPERCTAHAEVAGGYRLGAPQGECSPLHPRLVVLRCKDP